MTSLKGKLYVDVNQTTGDSQTAHTVRGAIRKLKVFSENEKGKAAASGMRSSMSLRREPDLANANDLKESSTNMGKGKGKIDSPAQAKARRKALADVSNLPTNSSRITVCGSSKQAVSVGPGLKAETISSKIPSMGKVRQNSIGDVSTIKQGSKDPMASSDHKSTQSKNQCSESFATYGRKVVNNSLITTRKSLPVLKRVNQSSISNTKIIAEGSRKAKGVYGVQGSKDPMASSDDKSTQSKKQLGESFDTYGSKVAYKSLIPMRKSLPVSKRVNQSCASNAKIIAEGSRKAKGVYGVPVKAKFNSKVAVQASNASSNLWRNRRSDGFIVMGPRTQSNVESRASSIKSVRPIVKPATLKASDAQRKLKSKCAPRKIEVLSVNSSSQKEEEVITSSSSIPEHVTSSIPEHGASHNVVRGGESPFGGQKDQGTDKPEIFVKRGRRRSYTSLLMAGPKLLEESSGTMKLELPSIDDSCNHLEVFQYIDEIYQYYWLAEAHNSFMENYMSIQTEITPPMRGILLNWLIEVHFKFDLMPETLYLMVTLLDQYLSQVKIKKSELQLVGLTALLLASKYEDFWHPKIKELLSISVESYTRDQMLGMEKLILRHLKFRLHSPTHYVFMLRFLKAAQADTKLEHLAFYLIDLCLVEYEALKFKPSLLCASAIYVARCTLQVTPAWTPLLVKHARYENSQIRECAEMILKFQKAARTGKLNVTYEKYLRPELSNAATIKPLNGLPF